MSKNNNTGGVAEHGLGFCSILTLIFITLKLMNIIQWSWLWVLAPLWLPTATTLAIILIVAIIVGGKKKWH